MSYFKYGDRDTPERRGHEWDNRTEEIKDRDNYTCQSCGVENVELHVHHIVKGRHLPVGNARVWSNLVTLCRPCHDDFEGLPPLRQFRRLGQQDGDMSRYRYDVADVIEFLQSGWKRKKEIRETLGIKKGRVDTILSNLVPMGCAIKNDDSRYRAPVAEVCRAERAFAERRIETLEGQLERVRNLREADKERIAELEGEQEESEGHLHDAVATLESARLELDAEQPVARVVKSHIKDAISSVEKAQSAEADGEDNSGSLPEDLRGEVSGKTEGRLLS